MTPDERRKLDEVYKFVQDMKNKGSIPLDVERALFSRIPPLGIALSSKGADTEDQTVVTNVTFDPNVVTTNTALNDPDGWLEVVIQGVTYFIPRYDA